MVSKKLLVAVMILWCGMNSNAYYRATRLEQINRAKYQRLLAELNEEYKHQNKGQLSTCADYCSIQQGSPLCITVAEMWQRGNDFPGAGDTKLILRLAREYSEDQQNEDSKYLNEDTGKDLVDAIRNSSHKDLAEIAENYFKNSEQSSYLNLASVVTNYILAHDILYKQELRRIICAIEDEMKHYDPNTKVDVEKEINAFPGVIIMQDGKFVEDWRKVR